MVKRSELSGDLIDGDTAASIRVRFGDGEVREVTVRADEAERLKNSGHVVSRVRSRFRRGVAVRGPAIAKWALALFVASLALPALTKQWSDRQSELEVKRTLVAELNSGVYAAYTAARVLPLTANKRRRAEHREQALREWINDEAVLDAYFAVYFSDQPVRDAWNEYRDIIHDYIYVCCRDDDDLDELRKYVERLEPEETLPEKDWRTLHCGLACSGYADAYRSLGQTLTGSQLRRDVRAAKVQGFSRGPRDFLTDIVSPLNPL